MGRHESRRRAPPFAPLPTRMRCREGGPPIRAWTRSGARTGAIGGAARMGTGTQAVRGAPLPPFACGGKRGLRGNAPLALPPPSMPVRWGRAEPEGNTALHVRTTLRLSRVRGPARPTFRVPHARRPACGAACAGWHAKGGARGTTRGVVLTPPSLQGCATGGCRGHARRVAQ